MARSQAEIPEYVVDALNDEQRRAIVSFVSSADDTVSLLELANHLTTPDAGGAGPTRSAPPSKKLLAKLHHVQLPELDQAGLVEYAPEKRRIAYAGEWVLGDGRDVEDVVDVGDALSAGLG